MDVQKIKALLLAVEKKSFSKAAEELSYTPSALSHIVDSIELELGVKILNRNFNGVCLNENGKILLDKLSALIEAENSLLIAAKTIQDKNTLRIGTYSSIAQHILPDLIKDFKQKHPEVTISIKVGNNLRDLLINDLVDINFADSRTANSNWLEFMTDPYVVLAHTDILKGKKVVCKEDLYGLPFIMHNETALNTNFDLSKFSEIIKFDSIDESSVITMVEQNIGIAILPSLMLKHKSKKVHTIKLLPEIKRTIGFNYKNDDLQTNGKAKFIKFIKNRLKTINN